MNREGSSPTDGRYQRALAPRGQHFVKRGVLLVDCDCKLIAHGCNDCMIARKLVEHITGRATRWHVYFQPVAADLISNHRKQKHGALH